MGSACKFRTLNEKSRSFTRELSGSTKFSLLSGFCDYERSSLKFKANCTKEALLLQLLDQRIREWNCFLFIRKFPILL
ncbi:hypothetical protein CpB0524 [Chlamydia pneumoniae TW-183]|uniref:Uncharacterized protein n=1 Tax=Chlamydia pneumoniae TaxID=83558 RepID=A0ABM5LCQ0_CHLPN|nr:hypothetical protein CpB0524 [Chlamydia pneumoniae TW-183]